MMSRPQQRRVPSWQVVSLHALPHLICMQPLNHILFHSRLLRTALPNTPHHCTHMPRPMAVCLDLHQASCLLELALYLISALPSLALG